jgi:L-2-hydroxyglutarate oxidase LhgO
LKNGFAAVVVGAGVVGLAVAASLARRGRSVLILERREAPCRETTSRNSQVIHAGIYYPEGSLKAALCVEGRERLYARCERLGIPHRQSGKLIVASDESEVAALEELCRRGAANGAPGLELVDADRVAALEPDVVAHAGLHSPRTGIVDVHAYADSLLAEAQARGAVLVPRSEVVAIERRSEGYRVVAARPGGERDEVRAPAVVNAAGLAADAVAALAGLDVEGLGYRLHPCKGDYFALAPGAPLRFSHLVYPLHGRAGLGVHVCLDLAGRILLGPDAEYVETIGYEVDATKAQAFAAAARRYLPTLQTAWLTPDQAGVRPRRAAPGQGFRDFVVAEEAAQVGAQRQLRQPPRPLPRAQGRGRCARGLDHLGDGRFGVGDAHAPLRESIRRQYHRAGPGQGAVADRTLLAQALRGLRRMAQEGGLVVLTGEECQVLDAFGARLEDVAVADGGVQQQVAFGNQQRQGQRGARALLLGVEQLAQDPFVRVP